LQLVRAYLLLERAAGKGFGHGRNPQRQTPFYTTFYKKPCVQRTQQKNLGGRLKRCCFMGRALCQGQQELAGAGRGSNGKRC